jgi:zinc/manganese transport system substrate-binding protein
MVKANHADLIVAVGLELEIGWLPSVIQGARNPKILKGQKGYLEVGPLVDPLEVPKGHVSRAEGDVHPDGNPHVTLDPDRAGRIANVIGERLAELDPEHASDYQKNAKALQKRLNDKTKLWQHRIDATKIKKIVTYHRTLTYFFDRFHLENPAFLEPKPGIPPTSGHIIEVIDIIKKQKIPLLLIENYFDPSIANRIKQEVPSIRSETVAVSVEGAPNIRRIDDLYENLVKAIEGNK